MCLGGEERGQAGRQQLSRGELVESGALRVPERSACCETFSEPRSPGQRVWSGIAGWSRDAGGPQGLCTPGKLLRPVWGDGRPEQSHIPSACTRCVRNPAVGGSLTLAAALYSGKCRGLPERPLRSQVAGSEASGEGAGAVAGRTDARCNAARPGSVPEPGRWKARGTGAEALRLCRSFPSIGKGQERKEVLASGGNNVTDERGRVGMTAAQAEGLGREPDSLETGCEFWWLEPSPSQEMKFYRRGRGCGGEARFRNGEVDDSMIWISGGP